MRTAIFYIVSAIGILAMINIPSAAADMLAEVSTTATRATCHELPADAGPTLLRGGECVSTDVTVLTPSTADMVKARIIADEQHIKDLEDALSRTPEKSSIAPYVWFFGCVVTSAASIALAHYIAKK